MTSTPKALKVRIGIGAGQGALSAEAVSTLATDRDDVGFDSLWLSEVLTAQTLDPLVGLAWAGAHNPRLKLGTTMLLPGRNPIRLAKELATLDRLSGGRLLVTLVPGLGQVPERGAIGVAPGRRSHVIEEVLPLLRRLWAGESVTHHGDTISFEEVSLWPLPAQQPLEIWLGGMARSSLDRCGRLSDGWLPSLCTPSEVSEGRRVVEDAAHRAGRSISPEHFGVSVAYSKEPLSSQVASAIASRSRGNDPSEVVPVGMDRLRQLLERFLEAGFSKFVVRPMTSPVSWRAELEELAKTIGWLQT
ncbi:MAG: LLM class flavin-dependent oxidoreductase [Acidimicrobiales bacterium]